MLKKEFHLRYVAGDFSSILKKTILSLALAFFITVSAGEAFAEININLRTFYFNRDFSGDTTTREALTQALRFDYKKEVFDSFEFGGSLFANAKLMDHGDSQLTGLLDKDGDGYAKLGQIYAQYRFEDFFKVKAGRWVMDTALLNDSDSRATPSSTQAIQVTANFKIGEVYALYSDRASAKTESDFDKYTDANGDDYEVVIIGGNAGFDNGLSFAAAYGNADDYSEQIYLNAGYKMNENFAFDATQYIGEGDGTNSEFDADLTNIVASYSRNKLKFSVGFQTVSGDSGYRFRWGGDDDNSLLTSNSVQILDFNRKDEDSWQIRADYEFSAVPGLKMMARHTWGEYKDDDGDQDEAETNVELMYTVSGTILDGLNLRMRYAHIDADAYEDIDEIRLIVNYYYDNPF